MLGKYKKFPGEAGQTCALMTESIIFHAEQKKEGKEEDGNCNYLMSLCLLADRGLHVLVAGGADFGLASPNTFSSAALGKQRSRSCRAALRH